MTVVNKTAKANFWGPVTATLDWCEANYQFSRYIAETANTWSNLVTVLLALYGVHQVQKASLPPRYLAGYAGFALVGLGSMIFHATLLYEAQLADELPMIYVATYCCAILFDTTPGFVSNGWTIFLGSTFLLFNFLFTWSYAVYRNPVYHQAIFASIMFTNGLRTAHLLRWSDVSPRIPQAIKTTVAKVFGLGAGLFAFGFFIWNLDNIFCNTITQWKHNIGWPAAFILEGHSWWHVFTATGTYLMLVGNTCKTLCIKDDHSSYELQWLYGLPRLDRQAKVKTA
ncbi:alkaline phytoceramidase [Panus rudis PR-1116 ss-1]|nr:alkaline phytoceramidase [Panus rudis PR-1116 ss-1]